VVSNINSISYKIKFHLYIFLFFVLSFICFTDHSWKCPACRYVSFVVPENYLCFCGKTKIPEWNHRDIAHSCGEICGRVLSKNNCTHKCTLLCHPGSCPQCMIMVTKYCGCGKTSRMLLCSTPQLLLCDSICNKDLSCSRHSCQKKCHQGECGLCHETIQQSNICIFKLLFKTYVIMIIYVILKLR